MRFRSLLRYLFTGLFGLCMHIVVYGEVQELDSLRLHFHFRLGDDKVDLTYRDNQRNVAEFIDGVKCLVADTTLDILSMNVVCSASPEGNPTKNKLLALDRASKLRSFLIQSSGFDPRKVKAYSLGIDWYGLVGWLERSDWAHRSQVLDVLHRYEETGYTQTQQIITQLKSLEKGRLWQWMLTNVYPDLRQGTASVSLLINNKITPPNQFLEMLSCQA